MRLIIPGLILLLPATGLSGCGPEQIQSLPLDREITIDGGFRDWDGALKYVEDANLSVGMMNDDRFLYIALVVGDRQVRRQITMSGLYLWFDPEAKESRQFGIRYPLGLTETTEDLQGLAGEPDPGRMREAFEASAGELMVIGSDDKIWRRGAVDDFDGIQVAADAGTDALVVELRIPLGRTARFGYGIGAAAGDVVAVGFESPEVDVGQMRGEPRHDPGGPPPGGGMGGGPPGGTGGGRGGMRGGPDGGGRPEIPEPIKVWTRVVLASGG